MTHGARVRPASSRPAFWVEGTRSEIMLDGAATAGRLAVLDELLPAGSGPPLHRHPQDEIYHVARGELTVWSFTPDVVGGGFASWPTGLLAAGVRCGPGATVFVPGGNAHCYRVGGAAAHVLIVSVSAGLESWTERFGVPATAPGLPPADVAWPAISREEIVAFSRARGVERLGPPAPPQNEPVAPGMDDVAVPAVEAIRGPGAATPPVVVTTAARERIHVGAARTEIALGGEHTAGRIALLDEWLPPGAAPPLHRHPEDETYLVRVGAFTFWGVDPALAPAPDEPWPDALVAAGVRCGPGDLVHIPGGTAHSWRVDSEGGALLVLSTPSGLDQNVRLAATAMGAGAVGERPAAGSSERLAGPPPAA